MSRALKALLAVLLLVLFPIVAGSYIGQVIMLVGLYILMGMGLNLEVGLAGLPRSRVRRVLRSRRLYDGAPDRRQPARACRLHVAPEPLLLGRDADRRSRVRGRRRAVRHSRARRSRRLSRRRHDGPRRNRARHRAVGFGRAAARRRPGHPANPETRSAASSSPIRSISST